MIALWLAMAGARAQECGGSPELTDPGAQLSVAWISPLGKRVRGKAWLYVVPTTELRAFAAGEGKGDVVRLLQWAGVRRSARPPHRRFKVVVFDVSADQICRPVVADGASLREGRLEGVAPCDEDHAGPHRNYAGCGWVTDFATGAASVQTYRARWNDLAANGFCLLPLARFVAAPEG
ncbi:MAG: hypothetical protein R3F59_35760 [Myxococcota bacterium]